MTTYKNLNTGKIGTYKEFNYTLGGKKMNRVKDNPDVVVEVILNGNGEWIEKK